ncbi:hypothetical protein ACFX1Z_018465 [Malus domestica]
MSFQDLEAGSSPRQQHQQRRPFVYSNAIQNQQQNRSQNLYEPSQALDTLQLRAKLHKIRAHIGQLMKNTSNKLEQASETDHHAQVIVVMKIADAKLAKDFQNIRKESQKAQRLAAERETKPNPWRLTDGAIERCRSSNQASGERR